MKRILFSFIFIIVTFGCATTTKPKTSVIYNIHDISKQLPPLVNSKSVTKDELPRNIQNLFIKLYELDPVVAVEIGRLPEYQYNIGDIQEIALRRFIDLLGKSSPDELNNLKELLKIGKPEFRRYCSPLQAIIWLLEKDEYDSMENPLKYDLNTLLKKSWNLNLLSRGEKNRWNDFDVVTERLNAPYLVDFYEQNQFFYEFSRKAGDLTANRYSLFKTKHGDCIDVTDFEVYCLRMGGYSAFVHNVGHIPGGYGSFHVVTLFEIDGRKYVMDNGRPWPLGIMPYNK